MEVSSCYARTRISEVVIEDGTLPVAVIQTPTDPSSCSISECIALAKKHEEETGEAPIIDSDFASDVEQLVRNRKPLNPPPWD